MIIAILILVIPAGVLVWEAQSDQVLVKVSSSGEFLLFPLETLCHLWQPVEPYFVSEEQICGIWVTECDGERSHSIFIH
jgi:hypothetical protein